MKRFGWSVIFGLFVTGCSEVFVIEEDPGNPYYLPPEGTLVRVKEELTVPPGWARVFIQVGEIISYGDLNHYYPSCNFELDRVSQQPQSIRPGEFMVYDVKRRDENTVQRKPVLYAGPVAPGDVRADAGGRTLLAEAESSGSDTVTRTVRMKLRSEQQPHVYMLTCRGNNNIPPDAEYVSINQMREALGEKAAIVLPEEQ